MTEWHFSHVTPYWWAKSGIAGAGRGRSEDGEQGSERDQGGLPHASL